MVIAMLLAVMLGIGYLVVWYAIKIYKSESNYIRSYQSWLVVWVLMFLVMGSILFEDILPVKKESINFVLQSVQIIIFMSMIQMGLYMRMATKEDLLWIPLTSKFMGPVKGFLTYFMITIPYLIKDIPSEKAVNPLTTGVAILDTYFSLTLYALLIIAFCVTPNSREARPFKVGLGLIVAGWFFPQVMGRIFPEKIMEFFAVSFLFVVPSIALTVIGIVKNSRVPVYISED